ncbi:MAG: energy-coupling factor ABC transporter substrate-binding protein [Coriobacteriia bacterium]|nr:energy-coupling factor ABC transporter substrate-binding protein [Coriobacteriia bacterium]
MAETNPTNNTVDSLGTPAPENGSGPAKKPGHRWLVPVLIILAIVISIGPLIALHGADFSGSDDAGSGAIEEVYASSHGGAQYVPWFESILPKMLGYADGEMPSEMESLFFCIQTGIGVGIIAFAFGYLSARKKFSKDPEDTRPLD